MDFPAYPDHPCLECGFFNWAWSGFCYCGMCASPAPAAERLPHAAEIAQMMTGLRDITMTRAL